MANPIALMAGFGALSIAGVLSFAQIHAASARTPEFGPVHTSATISPKQTLSQAASADASQSQAPVALAHNTPRANLNVALAAPIDATEAELESQLFAQITSVVATDAPYNSPTSQTSDDYNPNDDTGYDGGTKEPSVQEPGGEDGLPITMPNPQAIAPTLRPNFGLSPRPRVSVGDATPQTARRKIRPTWAIGVYR